MRRSTAFLLPLSAGLLFAQAQNGTTWNGRLVDAACQTTRAQEVTKQADGQRSVTTTEVVSCPVTDKTSTFGLMTSEGKYIRFDDASNTRVLEIVRKSDKDTYNKGVVRIVGTEQGGLAVVQTVNPAETTTTGGAERVSTADQAFDVDHEGDKGKLIVTATGVQWENINRADRSDKWTFEEIKEFRKDGQKQIELEPFKGKRYEFDVIGDRDTAYQAIADRIAAARPRQ